MAPVKTGDGRDLIYSPAQYTIYIAVRVAIDVVSSTRIEG